LKFIEIVWKILKEHPHNVHYLHTQWNFRSQSCNWYTCTYTREISYSYFLKFYNFK